MMKTVKNSGISTLRVSTEATGYYVGEHIKMGKKYYKIIDVKHTLLTIKPWRWYHHAYYRTKWWILERVHAVKDFWGRVLCAKGYHDWEFFRGWFQNTVTYYLEVRKCKRCPEEHIQLAVEKWTRRGSIVLCEELRNIKMTERIYDQKD